MVIAALVIIVLNQLKINIGRVWLTAATFALINWGIVFALKWFYPIKYALVNWIPFSDFYPDGFLLQMDIYSWPIALALCAIQIAIIFSDSTNINNVKIPNVWAGVFLINAVGILAVFSASVLSILLLWTIIDLVELVIFLRTVYQQENIIEAVISFAVRTAGVLLLMIGALISQAAGFPLSIGNIHNISGLIILIAIGLRLGVLPFNLPYSKSLPLRRGLGNAIRMVVVSSSLIILVRLSSGLPGMAGQPILLTLSALASLFAAIMWVVSEDELIGRPYWIISFAGLAIFSALKGNVNASLVWSLDLLIVGSVLFLYSDRNRLVQFLPLFSLIGLVGLPFTPSASGWSPLLVSENFLITLINIFSMIFLIFGFMRFALRKERELTQNERWVWIIFPLGLIFPIITHWIVFLNNDLDWIQPGNIWASSIAFLLPLLVFMLIGRLKFFAYYSNLIFTLLNRIGKIISQVLSFNWLYKGIWGLSGLFERIVNLFSNMLEGKGGIMWVFVLVALIITIISPQGNP
jgi:uncharacterized membrane protein